MIAVIIYRTETEIQTLFDSYVLIICNGKHFATEQKHTHTLKHTSHTPLSRTEISQV